MYEALEMVQKMRINHNEKKKQPDLEEFNIIGLELKAFLKQYPLVEELTDKEPGMVMALNLEQGLKYV